jgi:hypothetical protein
MVGSDFLGAALRQSMTEFGVSDEFLLPVLDETPQSIIIFDSAGRRMVNTDLKDVGERLYSLELFNPNSDFRNLPFGPKRGVII